MALEELALADTPTRLIAALDSLQELPVVGVDVERSDWDRYYRAAALIQIGGGGRAVLVDPMSLDDLSPVQRFLEGRTAVLHACDNDLEPLAAAGIRPPCVEDTALAAAVLGLPMGLEALLGELLGVELAADKSAMQRADWEARPLTDRMQTYAAGDVADLPALWTELDTRLHTAGRASWYREEMAAALALPPAPARRAWTRTKGAGRLNRLARARFRSLWETRERLGRDTDTAPGRIAGDKTLLDLAATPPAALAELGRRGVRRQAVRQFGDELLAAASAAPSKGAHADEPTPGGRRPTEADRDHADQLRALRSERAEQLGLAPGVLCPNRTLLTAVLADPESPEQLRAALGLRGWQWEQLGDAFCEALDLTGPGRPAPVVRGRGPTMADVLNPDALHHGLDTLDGWTGTLEGITKTFTFADFAESMRFVNWVADLAEDINHHPDIHISWNTVRLDVVTHSAGGVTQTDLDLAEKIEQVPDPGAGAT